MGTEIKRGKSGNRAKNIISARVREARFALSPKVTQEDLAGRLAARNVGLDRSAIARIELGRRYEAAVAGRQLPDHREEHSFLKSVECASSSHAPRWPPPVWRFAPFGRPAGANEAQLGYSARDRKPFRKKGRSPWKGSFSRADKGVRRLCDLRITEMWQFPGSSLGQSRRACILSAELRGRVHNSK